MSDDIDGSDCFCGIIVIAILICTAMAAIALIVKWGIMLYQWVT